jgi:hypothetical protein
MEASPFRCVDVNAVKARQIALAHLEKTASVPCAIIDVLTTESEASWFFAWNTREAVESAGARGRLTGLGPICVRKRTGEARTLSNSSARIFEKIGCSPGEEARTRDGAYRIAAHVADRWFFENDLVVLDESTRETPRLWTFVFQSRAYARTQDFRDMLIGLGLFVVEKRTGAVHLTGTANPYGDLKRIERRARWSDRWHALMSRLGLSR